MTDDTIKDALIKARALIQDPKHWTQVTLAKARNGRHVKPKDKEAVRFCTVGALHRVCAPAKAITRINYAALMLFGCPITDLNDFGSRSYPKELGLTRSVIHKRVLAAYDRAIKECGHIQ